MSSEESKIKYTLDLRNADTGLLHRVVSTHDTIEEAEKAMKRLEDSIASIYYLEINVSR